MRKSGVLLPISAIPSAYGIGGFSKEAFRFVDHLQEAGISYWQILPLGPTGYGDSPYQSFSTFAGNPYYIDLEQLIDEGLLTKKECNVVDYGGNDSYVDYEKIFRTRFKLLRLAFSRSGHMETERYKTFCSNMSAWLENYAMFMSIKDSLGGKSFSEWPDDIKRREEPALRSYGERLGNDVDFYKFLQFEFYKQWDALKLYANDNGVKIIGDIPIYVAFDSADTWANPELFQLDEAHNPTAVAGCPPDAFSATGQLWGNPLYNWDYHRNTGFDWWVKRIAHCCTIYDVVRVDHFRGFDEYYSIPYGDPTAENGHWCKGPGIDLFNTVKWRLGDVSIIAEDLGFLTDSVKNLVRDTGYPSMKVLQFAFDSREPSNYLPHNYNENCVVYTGTHDNDTSKGWFKELSRADKAFAMEYMGGGFTGEVNWDLIRMAFSSVARLAVIPMQDFLGLGSEGRTNTPSTLGDNWKWRMKKNDFTKALEKKIRRLNWIYARL
ncbi:MAG: 4-alpha-glucanotransferase [Lachnospiraceae bacterium]|nr:4-alpha-glucanotransferase [Lachnospiraceae bacterium]